MKMDKIKAALASLLAEDAFGSLTTDKGIIRWEGDDELAIGDAVMTVKEDGREEVAVDGEYLTEDNKIVIKSGVVEAIEEAEAEVVEEGKEDEAPAEDAFARFRAAYELSYDEKEQKIAEAVKAQGYVDCYVVEAGDDYAVVAVYEQAENGEFSEKLFRYELKWENDEVELGEPQEVKPAFIPSDEEAPLKEESIEEGYGDENIEKAEEPTIEVVMEPQEWEKKIAELEDRIAKIEDALKNTEVVSAEEQYNRINSFSVSDKKDEKIAKMFNLR